MADIFFEVHQDLPREGPGDNESTRKAYSMLQDIPDKPRILDVGCGPGMQTIELAKLSGGMIEAIDSHQPFLEHLRRRTKLTGVRKGIGITKGDMHALAYKDHSFDLIWSEGAIYIIGFEKGLCEWRRLLTPKGHVVVSELSWLKPEPPKEIRNYFSEAYPAMRTIRANFEIAGNTGYCIIGSFVIPEKSWWDNYYSPIEKKIPALKSKYQSDGEALRTLANEELEIEMFRKYAKHYGYVFYILQRKAD